MNTRTNERNRLSHPAIARVLRQTYGEDDTEREQEQRCEYGAPSVASNVTPLAAPPPCANDAMVAVVEYELLFLFLGAKIDRREA